MCKNTADNKWYIYDDSKVEAASEDQVVTPDAYILFYQVRVNSQFVTKFKKHYKAALFSEALSRSDSVPTA